MTATTPNWIVQLERLAESQGGSRYPWRSRLRVAASFKKDSVNFRDGPSWDYALLLALTLANVAVVSRIAGLPP